MKLSERTRPGSPPGRTAETPNDRYTPDRAVQTWDADAEYRLTSHLAIFLAGRNINNAVTRWSLDGPGAPEWTAVENNYANGAQYSLGIKGSF